MRAKAAEMREKPGNERGFTLLEFVAVVVVISLLASSGLVYYGKLLDDTRRTGVEILANRFTAAVALIHAHWIIGGGRADSGAAPRQIDVDGVRVYVNERGWAANTSGNGAGLSDQTADECRQIWQAVLQNPAPLTVEGQTLSAKGTQRYHVAAINGQICRYELVTQPAGTHFFDYNLMTGQVLTTVPPLS